MDYLRENLDLEHEKLYSDAELEKKDNQVYMKFRSENCEKEMSATQAMGLMLTYDSFCIVNQSGLSSDWMLTYMAQENLHSALEQMPTMYAVGIRRSWDAGSSMVPFLRRGSPARDAVGFRSFVHRSLACVISACYDLWKTAYASNKQVQQYYLVLDLGFTSSSVYLVSVKHVGVVNPS